MRAADLLGADVLRPNGERLGEVVDVYHRIVQQAADETLPQSAGSGVPSCAESTQPGRCSLASRSATW